MFALLMHPGHGLDLPHVHADDMSFSWWCLCGLAVVWLAFDWWQEVKR